MRDLPLAPTQRIGLEVVLLRMLAFTPASQDQATPAKKTTKSAIKKSTKQAATPNELSWEQLLKQLHLPGAAGALAMHCTLVKQDQTSIDLRLNSNQKPLLTNSIVSRINNAINEYYGREMQVNIDVGAQQQESPASKVQRQTTEKQAQAVQTVAKDEKIQAIISQFDGKIVSDSTQAVKD